LPFVPQLDGPWSLQRPRGSGLSAATITQCPGEAASAQVLQVPVQAFSQHTPSTQKPDAHSPAPPHVKPSGLGPQVLLAWQTAPSSQSWFPLQTLVQAPFWHRPGWQFWTPGGRQVPRPSQVPAVFSRFPVHDGARQSVSRA
jgi:hypothetical protein